jgi:hypothetical protein
MHSTPAPGAISLETVSQAGAGALLITTAVVELWLAFWAAGWWHRGAASLVAAVGTVVLARAFAALLRERQVMRELERNRNRIAPHAPVGIAHARLTRAWLAPTSEAGIEAG